MKIKFILIFISLLSINVSVNAQFENINVKFGDYTFKTRYDTNKYSTTLRIIKDEEKIFESSFDGRITEIKEYDLNNDGKKEILMDMYSGGAHCCTSLYVGKFSSDKFKFLDTIFWGNSFYAIHDFNNDGKKEILGANDMFAYAFTNFAESEFNILIYAFENNKFADVTKNYPKLVEEDIEDHFDELKKFRTDSSFACPENDTTDTFNTDAGSVKAILAPVVADYYTIGNVQKGYDIVDSVYKCPDRNKFIQKLQNDFKLK